MRYSLLKMIKYFVYFININRPLQEKSIDNMTVRNENNSLVSLALANRSAPKI